MRNNHPPAKFPTKFHIIKNEADIYDKFIVDYDDFIDNSNTEDLESFYRKLAYSFFKKGYETAIHDTNKETLSLRKPNIKVI